MDEQNLPPDFVFCCQCCYKVIVNVKIESSQSTPVKVESNGFLSSPLNQVSLRCQFLCSSLKSLLSSVPLSTPIFNHFFPSVGLSADEC